MMFWKYPKHDVKHYEKPDVLHHVFKNDRNVSPVEPNQVLVYCTDINTITTKKNLRYATRKPAKKKSIQKIESVCVLRKK